MKNLLLKPVALTLAFAMSLGALTATSVAAESAEDGAFLDQPYRHKHNTIELEGRSTVVRTKRSDVAEMISRQSPVQAQLNRGTCSIFSAVAYFESHAITQGATDPDLSEEFLEYVMMNGRSDDGSSSPANLQAVQKHGLPSEQLMPYIGETWTSVDDSELAQERCGKVPRPHRKSCLLGHRDPRLLEQPFTTLSDRDPDLHAALQEAVTFRDTYLTQEAGILTLSTSDQVKKSLLSGSPLLLDLEFFYGTWNHRKATQLGIRRDMEAWENGILGFPEPGTVDYLKSPTEPAGHSVLVVGYDDEAEIQTQVNMPDGTTREFKYKGVYIFKNSWGTEGFGKNFTYRGKTYPGYGMMPQKYGNRYGTFFRMASE